MCDFALIGLAGILYLQLFQFEAIIWGQLEFLMAKKAGWRSHVLLLITSKHKQSNTQQQAMKLHTESTEKHLKVHSESAQ